MPISNTGFVPSPGGAGLLESGSEASPRGFVQEASASPAKNLHVIDSQQECVVRVNRVRQN